MLPLTASNGTSGATIPIGHGRNTNNPHSRDSRVKALNAYQEVENATIDDMLIRKVAAAKAGTTIGRGDRTAALVDALSSSLASFARTADDVEDEAAANADSSSTSGDNHASDRDSSTANGSGSRHVVTATQTTSSGDDRDSGTASGGGISGGITSEYSAPGSQRELISRHHHHHRFRRRVPTNDGSALQVPGDDGSDRLAGGPATVVASRLYPRNSDTTTNTSSSGSGGEGEAQDSLLQPHREPGYHTIRRTFSKLPKRDVRREPKSSATDSSSTEEGITKKVKGKHGLPKPASDVAPKAKKKKPSPRAEDPKARARGRGSPSPDSVNSNPPDGGGGGSLSGSGTEGGSSSGSGTEGGYAGDAQQESCSSPSVSSSEESRRKSKSKRHRTLKEDGQHKSSKQEGHGSGNSSSSSELADFSSGSNSDDGEEAGGFTINVSPSTSPSLSSSSNDLEETYIRVKRAASVERKRVAVVAEAESWTRHRMSAAAPATKVIPAPWPRTRIRVDVKSKLDGRTPILNVGCDIMAHVLTFLQPPEILNVLTMPLSKVWRQNFTCQAELWRVLCLVEPFKAKIADEDADDSSSADSFYNPAQNEDYFDRRLLDRYRLLYTSFVRCMNYLSQIREDAINGRTPSYIDYGGNGDTQSLVGTNKSLQSFLARARGVVSKSKRGTESSECSDISEQEQEQKPMAKGKVRRQKKV